MLRIDHRALQLARAAPYRMSSLARAMWWRAIVHGVFQLDVTETQLGPQEAYGVEELRTIGCRVERVLRESRVYIQISSDAASRRIFGDPSPNEIYGVLASFYCRVGHFHAPNEPFCISVALAGRISRLLLSRGYVVSTSPLPDTSDIAVYLVGINDAYGRRVRMSLPRSLKIEREAPRGTEFEWRY